MNGSDLKRREAGRKALESYLRSHQSTISSCPQKKHQNEISSDSVSSWQGFKSTQLLPYKRTVSEREFQESVNPNLSNVSPDVDSVSQPSEFECGQCKKNVKQPFIEGVMCQNCFIWNHLSCLLKQGLIQQHKLPIIKFYCQECKK